MWEASEIASSPKPTLRPARAEDSIRFGASAPPSRSAPRAETQAQLVAADRELNSVRDELHAKTTEGTMLKTALQREHEVNLRLQTKHESEMDQMRSEYERQLAQLSEQLAVMKGVSESALQDRKRIADESEKRKAQLLDLLEQERAEKTRVMAEYRVQTEALIGEQGREISSLRALLEAARADEGRLLAAAQAQEEHRAEHAEALLRLETQLNDERHDAQRRIREMEGRHHAELESLKHQHGRKATDFEQRLSKLEGECKTKDEAIRRLHDQVRAVESQSDAERSELRGHYEGCIEKLTGEIHQLKAAKDSAVAQFHVEREAERLSHADVQAALKNDLHALRREKQALLDQHRVDRDTTAREHQQQLQDLLSDADQARLAASSEQQKRKEAESRMQALSIRVDDLQAANTRLQQELERHLVDARMKERLLEQQASVTEDKLRSQLREIDAEASSLRQKLAHAEHEAIRAADHAASETKLLQSQLDAAKRQSDSLRVTLTETEKVYHSEKSSNAKTIDTLQAERVKLEADLSRKERDADEWKSKNDASARQLAEERSALDALSSELHAARNGVAEARSALQEEKAKVASAGEMTSRLQQKLDSLSEQLSSERQAAAELERTLLAGKEELSSLRRAHELAIQEARDAAKKQSLIIDEEMSAARELETKYRDAALKADAETRTLRDEITRWQREVMALEDQLGERTRAIKADADAEVERLTVLIGTLRDETNKAHAAKLVAQRDNSEAIADAERRVSLVQEALDQERLMKHRLHEELRTKDQVLAEAQGTSKLLSTRLATKEDDLRRAEDELHEATTRLHEAHSQLGKREAAIGQLQAKLRVFESTRSVSAASSLGAHAYGDRSHTSVNVSGGLGFPA